MQDTIFRAIVATPVLLSGRPGIWHLESGIWIAPPALRVSVSAVKSQLGLVKATPNIRLEQTTNERLEKAYEERSWWMPYLSVDAAFDPLRSDPRFQDLLRRVNFPP
jgi:hypothetical protein